MRKDVTKVIAKGLCCALVLGAVNGGFADAKKGDVAFEKSSITLEVKKSKTVKLKNIMASQVKSATYTSSNEKVVVVKKKSKLSAKVTAKKVGKATVTAKLKIGKKSKKVSLKVQVKKNDAKTKVEKPVVTDKSSTPIPSATPTPALTQAPTNTPTVLPTGDPNPVSTPTKLDSVKVIPYADTNLPANQQMVYDLSKETGGYEDESYAPPVVCPYSKFHYDSFKMWLCRAFLQSEYAGEHIDYRRKVLNYSITLKNTGKNDLPYLSFCLNCTTPSPSYPVIMDVIDRKVCGERLVPKLEKLSDRTLDTMMYYARNEKATKFEYEIKAGTVYNYQFHYTIPEDAINGDKNSVTGENYPILMYLANCKDLGIYAEGDEVTILDCKITVADDNGVEAGIYQVDESTLPTNLQTMK